jgi:cytochrome b561
MSTPRRDDSFLTAGLAYDRISILMHWATASLIVLLWTIAHLIDAVPKGTPRTAVRSLHIALGALLGLLLLLRLAWRTGWGRRLPPADAGIPGIMAKLTHWGLYLLIAGTVALGVTNAWVRGDTVIGLFTITSFAPGDKALHSLIENLHATFANVLLITAGLHALAGLVHHFVLHDNVLRRMLPGRVAAMASNKFGDASGRG